MPVHEIELLIGKLNGLLATDDVQKTPKEAKKLYLSIQNWHSVLKSHRERSSDVVPMFSAEDEQFRKMVEMYDAFQKGGVSESDVLSAVHDVKEAGLYGYFSATRHAFSDHFNKAFQYHSDACSQVIPSHQNKYLRNICDSFEASKWTSTYQAIMGACSMSDAIVRKLDVKNEEGSPDISTDHRSLIDIGEIKNKFEEYTGIVKNTAGKIKDTIVDATGKVTGIVTDILNPQETKQYEFKGLENPFRKSQLIAGMCKDGAAFYQANATKNFPGGPLNLTNPNYPQGMLSFLADKNQYITFGANAPISLTWTSTVSEANEQASSFASSYPRSIDGTLAAAVTLFGITLHFDGGSGVAYGSTFSIGRVSSNGHDFDRTVTITLDDADLGIASTYFDIKLRRSYILKITKLNRRLLCSPHHRG
jgi:hypothetical protein